MLKAISDLTKGTIYLNFYIFKKSSILCDCPLNDLCVVYINRDLNPRVEVEVSTEGGGSALEEAVLQVWTADPEPAAV
jgi:hypothetical protein